MAAYSPQSGVQGGGGGGSGVDHPAVHPPALNGCGRTDLKPYFSYIVFVSFHRLFLGGEGGS